MIAQLQPDPNVPPQIYELANSHGVGTPLKRHKRRFLQIVVVIELLVLLFAVVYFCYIIYGYIAFSMLSHTYPNINDVPLNQLDNYIWLQALHDAFWQNILQIATLLLGLVNSFPAFYSSHRTKLYICTDGLLKVYKKKDEAIRWVEVKELYLTNGNVSRLVKQDGSNFLLPALLMSGRRKTMNMFISDEVTRYLLPEALASYERGETVRFGTLEANQQGIYRPGGMVHWPQLGDIALEKGQLSAYYSEKTSKKHSQGSSTHTWKWHTWQKSSSIRAPWPNLPVLVALVNHVLDQQDTNYMPETSLSQNTQSLKETAIIAKYKDRRRKRVTIAAIIAAILGIFSLCISLIVYQSVEEQRRADRDIQLIRDYVKMMAHKPYYARVPGQHCDHGKGYWYDDSTNVYTCRKDGLLMTQKDTSYQDETYFSFDASDQLTYTGLYIPHHYRVQVQATIVSGWPSTCVSLQVHLQDFQGRQDFDVCADGSWSYSRCDLHCNTDIQIVSGNLPHTKSSYLIAVDVTDSVQTLIVDNKKIASIKDNTYSSTDEIVLALYGDQNAREPITALFSDFHYTPYL